MFSSVIEFHFDPAIFSDQYLEIEESSVEMMAKSVQRIVQSLQISPTSLSLSRDEPGFHIRSPDRQGDMISWAPPPPQSCRARGPFSAVHGGTSVPRCPPQWSLQEHW